MLVKVEEDLMMKKLFILGLFVIGMILPNINVKAVSIGGVEVPIVDSGDGLYTDDTRAGRYVYKGTNPNNYIEFNNELWRIVAKEADGTYKIVRNEVLPEEMPFDNEGYRDSESNGAGGTYCANYDEGCNSWAATKNLVESPAEFTNTTQTGTVLLDSNLNTYLNGTYYNSLSNETKELIVSHAWGVGATYTDASFEDDDIDSSEFVTEESRYIWNGKVALLSSSDVLLATGNPSLCGTYNRYDDNLDTCASLNYLIPNSGWYWLLSPYSYTSNDVSGVFSDGVFDDGGNASWLGDVRPAVYIASDLKFEGDGSKDNLYQITGKIENETTTDTENTDNGGNNQSPQVVEVPSTSAYASIIIAVLGIICVIISVFVMRRVTKKEC